jgi:hypothetical protein
MPIPTYSTEMHFKIYHNREGVAISVGVDGDVSDLVEVSTQSTKDKEYYGDIRLVMEPELALKVAKAMVDVANFLIERAKNES